MQFPDRSLSSAPFFKPLAVDSLCLSFYLLEDFLLFIWWCIFLTPQFRDARSRLQCLGEFKCMAGAGKARLFLVPSWFFPVSPFWREN